MHRNQLVEDLNYIMLEKRYGGKLRDFESLFKKVMMYGVVASITSFGFFPIGVMFVYIYRYGTDKCRKACGSNTQCYNKCYYVECEKVISLIQTDIKNLKNITDPSKRKRVEKALRKELEIWVERRNSLKEKIVSINIDSKG
mgnify:CR=1 FL=1